MEHVQEAGPISEKARELIKGAYDIHQHVAPDLWERSADAFDFSRRASALGMAGFVLKNHCVETATWAAILRRVFDDLEIFGTHVVNYASGGWNPQVVETSLMLGARIVYMPTIQSEHTIKRLGLGTGPLGIAPAPRETPAGYPKGLSIFGEDASILDPVWEILRLVKEYRVALGTGHLSSPEVMAIVDAAQSVGVERIILTHMSFPIIGDVSENDQIDLAKRGLFFEHSYQTTKQLPVIQKPTTIDHIISDIRRVGLERSVFSSNYGQPQLPSPELGLLEGLGALADAGVSDEDIDVLVRRNPVDLISP
jgi:hypothetical protein